MTPLAPRTPYIDAPAFFSSSTRSISAGLKVSRASQTAVITVVVAEGEIEMLNETSLLSPGCSIIF